MRINPIGEIYQVIKSLPSSVAELLRRTGRDFMQRLPAIVPLKAGLRRGGRAATPLKRGNTYAIKILSLPSSVAELLRRTGHDFMVVS